MGVASLGSWEAPHALSHVFPGATQVHTYPRRGWELGQYLGIEGMLEDLTESFCIDLRLPCLGSVQDGGFDPLGHGLSHQLG